MELGVFDIESKVTNEQMDITYTPGLNVTSYSYVVTKDDEVIDSNVLNNSYVFSLTSEGKYVISITETDINGNTNSISNTYVIDKQKPVIKFKNNNIKIHSNENFDLKENVIVTDNYDGDLTNKVIISDTSLKEAGIKKVFYVVSDEAGNTASKVLNLNVVENTATGILFIQGIIAVAIMIVLYYIYKFQRSASFEKKISKYTIDPIIDSSDSLLNSFLTGYLKVIDRIKQDVRKSVFLTKYAKKYEKYVGVVNSYYKEGLDLVINKFVIALSFLVVAIFAKGIQFKPITYYELLLPFVAGFFLPDLIYTSKYRVYRNKIENDLLQAIIIMNNAFKSGRSILQAIDLVTTELEGPICEEFKKMHLEMSFGLNIDVVFERFNERIKLEEVTYLTASLSILNKTGGNIIKVFSSIEKSLFNKKKLKLELASLTGSSKIIVYVLFIVPPIFALFISLVSPGYFMPLVTSPLGLVFLIIMIVYYIIYIICVNKIMKVRM